VNRAKKQGTAAELRWIRRFEAAGLKARSQRDSGNPDANGDIEVTQHWIGWAEGGYDAEFRRIVGEIKDRQSLNPVATLKAAIRRSGTHRTFVGWTKRRQLEEGRQRRTTEGDVVVISTEFFLELLGGQQG
jgi:hypothetical protein